MNEKQFKDQKTYSAAVSILRSMKESGLISDEEFKSAINELKDRYKPLILCIDLI